MREGGGSGDAGGSGRFLVSAPAGSSPLGPAGAAAGMEAGHVSGAGLPASWRGGLANSQPPTRSGFEAQPMGPTVPVPVSAATAALPVGHDRAAALFRAYDVLGRGALDRASMVAALAELGVAAGLGEEALNAVLAQDPATSREHRYTLHEFLAMYERVGLYVAKVARGERIRALSGAAGPPPNAERSPQLRAVFSAYCRFAAAGTSRLLVSQAERGLGFREELEPRMNAQQLLRLCQDLELVQGGPAYGASSALMDGSGAHPLTFSSVDVAFAKSKAPGGPRRLNYTQWLKAVGCLGEECGRDLFSLILAHVSRIQQYAPPQAMEAVLKAAGVPAKAGPGAGGAKGAGSNGGGLPKLRTSGSGAPPSDGGHPGSNPGPYSNPDEPLPGRLTLLERAIEDEVARAAAAEEEEATTAAMAAARASAATGHSPMAARKSAGGVRAPAPRSVPASRPVSVAQVAARAAAGADAASPPVAPKQAWAEQRAAAPMTAPGDQAGAALQVSVPADGAQQSPSNQPGGEGGVRSPGSVRGASRGGVQSPARSDRNTSPTRGGPFSPGYAEPKVHMVNPAGVVQEVWRLPPGMNLRASQEAMNSEPPPWFTGVLERLQALETSEAERLEQADQLASRIAALEDGAAEAAAAAANAKKKDAMAPDLEARVAALERHAARAEAAIAELKVAGSTPAAPTAIPAAASSLTDAHIEALQEQLKLLESALDALGTEAAKASDIKALQDQVDLIESQAASAEGFQELSNRMDSLEAAAAAAPGGLKHAASSGSNESGGNAAAGAASERLDELEESLGGLASAMQDMARDQGEKLSELQQQIEALRAAGAGAAAPAGGGGDGGAEAAALAQAVQRDLHAVQERFKVNENTLIEAEAKIDHLESMLDALRPKAELAHSTARAAEASAAAAITKEQLDDRLADLKTEIASAAANMAITTVRGGSGKIEPAAAPGVDAAAVTAAAQAAAAAKQATDALAAKVVALEAAVTAAASKSDLGAAQTDSQTGMASLAQEMQAVAARLTGMEGQVARLQQEGAGSQAAAGAGAQDGAKVGELESQLSALRGEASAAQEAAAAASSACAGLDAKMDALTSSLAEALAKAEQALASASAAASAAPAAPAPVAGGDAGVRLDGIDNRLVDLAARISATESLASHIGRVEAAAQAAAEAATAAKDAQARMEGRVAAAEGLARDAAGVGARVDALQAQVTQLAASAGAASAAAGAEAAAAAASSAVANATLRIDELEAKLGALATAVAVGASAEPGAPRGGSVSFGDGGDAGGSGKLARPKSAVKKGGLSTREEDREAVARATEVAESAKKEVEVLKTKMQQLFQQINELKTHHAGSGRLSTPGVDGAESGTASPIGGGPRKAGTPTTVNTGLATPAERNQAAAMQALQANQMAAAQQLTILQASLTQMAQRLTVLENVKAVTGGGGSGPDAHTVAQMELLQGAIVQLNGEVSSLKMAVPQLAAAASGSGANSSVVMAAAAAGSYGPELRAVAEEVQRAAVRSEVVERDVRVALTGFARAADVSGLESAMREKLENVDAEMEALRQAVRRAVEDAQAAMSGGRGGLGGMGGQAMARPPGSALPGSAMPGGGDGGGGDGRKFATWDALRQAEQSVAKVAQGAREDVQQVTRKMNDAMQKVDQLSAAVNQRLEMREKVLMRMAKEMDELKAQLAQALPKSLANMAAVGAGGSGGGANSPARGGRAAQRPGRSSMFDE